MRKARILKVIANTSVAVGLGAMGLFGGVAHADTFQQRVQAELNSGKDYSAAWAEASRATGPLYASDAYIKRAESAMYQGRDYAAAWEEASRPATVFSADQVAKAQNARQEMNEGKDYVAAWEATTNEQPEARVHASSQGGGAGGQARTRSTK